MRARELPLLTLRLRNMVLRVQYRAVERCWPHLIGSRPLLCVHWSFADRGEQHSWRLTDDELNAIEGVCRRDYLRRQREAA